MDIVKDDYEILFTKLTKKEVNSLSNKFYVFIRNYNTVSDGIGDNIFRKGIKVVDTANPLLNIIYTHSTINTVLNDNFIGLSPNSFSNLYIEVIDPKNRSAHNTKMIGHNNAEKSLFSVWYSEISKSDYILLQKLLNEHIKHKDKITYNYLNIGKIAVNKIVNRILNVVKSNKSSEALEITNEKLVCSTFVAYILKFLNKFKNKIDDFTLYSPTDIVSKLDFKHLVSGKWVEYNDLISDIINKNPEFKPFLLNLNIEV